MEGCAEELKNLPSGDELIVLIEFGKGHGRRTLRVLAWDGIGERFRQNYPIVRSHASPLDFKGTQGEGRDGFVKSLY
ncbi:MAG: hypothetical protein NVSMB14_10940 [Isosphaeraceae bacterium]